MDSYIYYVFILKNLFQNLFGVHYPTEIIGLIVLTLYKPMQIVAGHNHTILIRGTQTYVWGQNKCGQLGLGDDNDRNSPQELSLRRIKSVSCGMYHTIALTEDDRIYSWGSNHSGQLGLGDFMYRNSPQELILPEIRIKSIVCGGYHTVVLTFCDTLYVWGYNDGGQLGLGDQNNRNIPQKLPLDHIKSVSCGLCHTIALTCQSEIYVWGQNQAGQLGLGDERKRYSPQKLNLNLLLSNIKSISCGGNYTIALTAEGFMYSWGFGGDGQLGLGDKNSQTTPNEILLSGIKSINCGRDHNVAISISGVFYVWGDNELYQLGLGDDKKRTSPQELILKDELLGYSRLSSIHPSRNIKMIVCGEDNTFVITNTDDIYVWGCNRNGELGLGDNTNRNSPCRLNFKF